MLGGHNGSWQLPFLNVHLADSPLQLLFWNKDSNQAKESDYKKQQQQQKKLDMQYSIYSIR